MDDAPESDWLIVGREWISAYFERNPESPALVCSPADMQRHSQFVGDTLRQGGDPTHFVATVCGLQLERRKAKESRPESTVTFRTIDYSGDEPREIEVELPLLDWIIDRQDGCIEDRLAISENITALMLCRMIEADQLDIREVADIMDFDGADISLTKGNLSEDK